MREHIFTLFCVCLVSAIGEIILPDGAKNSTRKAFRFLSCLVVLLLILTPFLRILGDCDTLFKGELEWTEQDTAQYEGLLEHAVIAQSEKELREGLCLILQNEYGVTESDCKILITFDESGALLHVSVFLSGNAISKNPSVIERDLAGRLNCSVEVR